MVNLITQRPAMGPGGMKRLALLLLLYVISFANFVDGIGGSSSSTATTSTVPLAKAAAKEKGGEREEIDRSKSPSELDKAFKASWASVMGFAGRNSQKIGKLIPSGQASPIMLTPPELIFKDTPICIPAVALVDVVNRSPKENLHLLEISANHPHFYPAMFKAQVLPPHGTTTIQVTFLPQAVGAIETSLTVRSR